jgi:hypothetical protein
MSHVLLSAAPTRVSRQGLDKKVRSTASRCKLPGSWRAGGPVDEGTARAPIKIVFSSIHEPHKLLFPADWDVTRRTEESFCRARLRYVDNHPQTTRTALRGFSGSTPPLTWVSAISVLHTTTR